MSDENVFGQEWAFRKIIGNMVAPLAACVNNPLATGEVASLREE